MTYTGAEYSTSSLLRELKKQVEIEHVRSFDQYKDLVDNLIEEKRVTVSWLMRKIWFSLGMIWKCAGQK